VSAFEQLLVVQQHDTHAAQLNHRRAVLPERTALHEAEVEVSAIGARLTAAEQQHHELSREQKRLEDQIAVLQAKATSVDKAMYGGTVSNVRELQAMGDEVKSLQRRVSQLEDQELEVMERIEPVEAEMAQLTKERADMADQAERLRAEVTVNEAEIDGDLERAQADREVAAAEIPGELLAEYDRLRRQLGGIGVARLVNGQCGGCHLKLSAVELDRLRRQAGDAVVHCDECGRLLVR